MLRLLRTHSRNPDFVELIKSLDAFLAVSDGDEHDFYAQYNKSDDIKHVLVAYQNEKPVGCGAFKKYEGRTAEIKRMYVSLEVRGQGIGKQILQELERWSKETNYNKVILETGVNQHEAIYLYRNSGYRIIPNYGQYKHATNSICFEKQLN